MLPQDAVRVPAGWVARLPFFYGWVVVAVAFVTMGVGVNTRTAFSLLFPPILEEFGWERGVTAGAFSFGFLVGTVWAPFIGLLMDRLGPRYVIPCGVVLVSAGLALTTLIQHPWQLYLILGALVVGGSIFLSYIGHSLFLPYWFVRRRGLAIGIAFSGVGVGAIVLFPWLQWLISKTGWREACWSLALLLAGILLPLNIVLQRQRPEVMGLAPDGDSVLPGTRQNTVPPDNVADPAWVAIDWTLRQALKTARFWWLSLGFLTGLAGWYTVQVHQTKYLLDLGFRPDLAAYALGFVPLTGVVGQIGLGHLSDRIGREWVWTLSGLGYILCYATLLCMQHAPIPLFLYLMVASQGFLGYGLAAVFGAIPAEIFQGRQYGVIFGTLSLAAGAGAGLGPWMAGALHDRLGNYELAFWLAMSCSLVSIVAIWLAAPRHVRVVAGQVARLHARSTRNTIEVLHHPELELRQYREFFTGNRLVLDEARARFERTVFAQFLGAELVEVATGQAVLRLPYQETNANLDGPLHGGATASLIHCAGALAAWTEIDLQATSFLSSVDLAVQYLAPARREVLTAEAMLLHRGRDVFFLEVTVWGGSEQRISKGMLMYRAPQHGDQPLRMATQPVLLAVPKTLLPPAAPPDKGDYTHKLQIAILHQQPGWVRLAMPYVSDHTDAEGNLHEGALASLIDTAGTQAAWSMVRRQGARGATLGIQISYTNLCSDDVVADAYIQQRSEELFVAMVQVTTVSTRQLVAMGNVSYRLLEAR